MKPLIPFAEKRAALPSFEQLLDESVKIHGHLCPGQVLGVRMAMLGLRLINIEYPKGRDRKSFIVYVEIDRCATDAIQSVTGCSLGKRSLKWKDYGIMAATFINLKENRAFRIVAKESSRESAKNYRPDLKNKYKQQLEAYKLMSDKELFKVMEVKIDIPACSMPGRPLSRVRCENCGDYVQDGREIIKNDRILCRRCTYGGYYELKTDEVEI